MQVVSLKRVGPGELQFTAQVENSSNVSYKLGAGPQLVDDQGDTWKYHVSGLVSKRFEPNVKTNLVLRFSRPVGGKDATSANFTFNALIGAPGQAKNYGRCMWQFTGIPIQ